MKNKKNLYLIIIVLLVIIIGGGLFFILSKPKKTNKEIFVSAIKEKSAGFVKILNTNKKDLKNKVINTTANLLLVDEKYALNTYVNDKGTYFSIKGKNLDGELYLKEDGIYYKDNTSSDKSWYFQKIDTELTNESVNKKIDEIFKDFKEEDIKKEKATLTVAGKEFKTNKLSYELTDEKIKKLFDKTNSFKKDDKKLNNGKLFIELYLYNDEIIKMVYKGSESEDKYEFGLTNVEIDKKDFYEVYLSSNDIKVAQFKSIEKAEGKYDLDLVVMGMMVLKGNLIKDGKNLSINLASEDKSMSLIFNLINKKDNEYNAKGTVMIMDQKIEFDLISKEVNKMPEVDLSMSKEDKK